VKVRPAAATQQVRAVASRGRWAVAGAGVVVVLAAVVWVVPRLLYPPLPASRFAGVTPDRRIELETNRLQLQGDARATLVQVLAGGILLLGAYLTWRQLGVNREGQITDRYTRAIDQLGHAQLDVRLGGTYALERIARDSPSDRATIGEVLTAFVRGHAPWPPRPPGQDPATAPIDEALELQVRAADVQASLTVLGRGGFAPAASGRLRLDLHSVDLRQAQLYGAHLERASLYGAHPEEAHLAGAHLEEAHLLRAYLEGAEANEHTSWPAGVRLARSRSHHGRRGRRSESTAAATSVAREGRTSYDLPSQRLPLEPGAFHLHRPRCKPQSPPGRPCRAAKQGTPRVAALAARLGLACGFLEVDPAVLVPLAAVLQAQHAAQAWPLWLDSTPRSPRSRRCTALASWPRRPARPSTCRGRL
jgi:Pentapeptide repeats (8 copies)